MASTQGRRLCLHDVEEEDVAGVGRASDSGREEANDREKSMGENDECVVQEGD